MLTGIVSEVINNGVGRGSGLKVDGHKYGCFDPVKTGIDIVAVGDEVSFEWVQKGQYKNIQGKVNKTGNTGTPQAAAPAASSGGGGGKSSGGGGDFVFPIPALNYQRSVVRRDALRDAVDIVVAFEGDSGVDAETAAARVVEIARTLEEYACGDDAEKAANAALEAMNTQED